MRLISFMLTERQIRERTKTQTRRLGWKTVKVGDRLRGVLKCQGRSRKCPGCDGVGWVWTTLPSAEIAQIKCVDCTGRGKIVEPLVDLAIVEVTAARRERLDAITPADVIAEGFPDLVDPDRLNVIDIRFEHPDFVSMFCEHMKCLPSTEVTVIEFKYVEGSNA